ncbi:hypothetical protein QQF64_030764 [Cirrhinus molitorella]|uniref:C-type lectin domain-containing protein n=1 Tax=Cirrhinus molitorella TaxID=172907 RepID=A0ABR3N4I8_9TELE
MNLNPCIVEENHSAILHKKGRRQRWSFFNKDSSSASAKITIYSFSHTFFTESFEVLNLIISACVYRKHYFVNDNKKWSDAQKYCRDHYNDLSTVSNEELQLLTANLQITKDFYWIGLRKSLLLSTRYTWTNGENAVLTDAMWEQGQPDLLSEECCAVLISSSKVHNVDCNWSKPFYCMEVLDLILMTQERTWEEALEYCRQNNNDLAILNSNEAMTEAKDTSAAALTDDVWIGLRFIAGRWVWVNGEEFQYNGWSSSGELQCPAMNQRCAVLNRMVWKPMDFFSGLDFREIPKAHFCGNGAEVFELILVQKENTWIEALEYCRQNHVDLAGLTSDLMMREAKNKSAPAHADDVWIGLRFIAGHWFWVDRSNVEYNGWWLEGEPQCPPVDQRCGVFDKNKTVWKPDNCERRLNFLCLKKYKVI